MLTPTIVASYIEHGLIAEILDYKSDYVGKQFDEIIGIHNWSTQGHWCVLTNGGSKPSLERIKLALRPLSDLIKTIDVNGTKIVPLYELCKMQGFSMHSPNDWEYSYSTEFNCNTAIMQNKLWWFRYIGKDNSFWLNGVVESNKKHQKSHRHVEMVQKLFEWHFDVFGLIEKGLAIDLNTVKG